MERCSDRRGAQTKSNLEGANAGGGAGGAGAGG